MPNDHHRKAMESVSDLTHHVDATVQGIARAFDAQARATNAHIKELRRFKRQRLLAYWSAAFSAVMVWQFIAHVLRLK